MCLQCNNTGVIRKETYPGVIETSSCNCEVAQQQEATYRERWNNWLERFERMVQMHEKRVG